MINKFINKTIIRRNFVRAFDFEQIREKTIMSNNIEFKFCDGANVCFIEAPLHEGQSYSTGMAKTPF